MHIVMSNTYPFYVTVYHILRVKVIDASYRASQLYTIVKLKIKRKQMASRLTTGSLGRWGLLRRYVTAFPFFMNGEMKL